MSGTVYGVLADNDILGQVKLLLAIFEGPYWGEVWDHLGLRVETFATLDLQRDASDEVVWRTCQSRQLILITANRRKNESDSLEQTIRLQNTPDSLPVFTLANATRVQRSKAYREKIVERL